MIKNVGMALSVAFGLIVLSACGAPSDPAPAENAPVAEGAGASDETKVEETGTSEDALICVRKCCEYKCDFTGTCVPGKPKGACAIWSLCIGGQSGICP